MGKFRGISQAARVGKKVLDGAAKGRAVWQAMQREERALKQRLILETYVRLKLDNWPDWGISGVIAQAIRRQGITLSAKQTKRYLDTFSDLSKLGAYGTTQNAVTFVGG